MLLFSLAADFPGQIQQKTGDRFNRGRERSTEHRATVGVRVGTVWLADRDACQRAFHSLGVRRRSWLSVPDCRATKSLKLKGGQFSPPSVDGSHPAESLSNFCRKHVDHGTDAWPVLGLGAGEQPCIKADTELIPQDTTDVWHVCGEVVWHRQ